jgi:LPXTG-site transpeptidase (sortase) family protein
MKLNNDNVNMLNYYFYIEELLLMSKKYIKRPVRFQNIDYIKQEVVEIKPEPQEKITLWDMISGLIKDLNELMLASKIAGFIIPASLIVFGVVIIFNQIWPEVEQYIKYNTGYYDTSTVALVAGDYVDRAEYVSNPGSEYFKNLSQQAREETQDINVPDTISNNYSGRFTLSISSVGLDSIPVTANVNSGIESEYQRELKNGLAHFSGTGLPISDVQNNIVIYGHSASGDYYERTHDDMAAFSMLNKVKVGDIVEVSMDGQTYKYRISRSKIVEPNDVSILTGQPGQKTLTMFTCFPNGNRAKRFVAIAKPV